MVGRAQRVHGGTGGTMTETRETHRELEIEVLGHNGSITRHGKETGIVVVKKS